MSVGIGRMLRRADDAVQDARATVSGAAIVAAAAFIIATVALFVAVMKD